MLVAEAVGRALAALGVDTVFGLMGSGNLAVTNALRDAGARFYAARHEGGAICMADGYGRVSGRLAACSVHQGPGLTNTMTGLTEAAKSRTPLIVLAPEMPAAAIRSNFRIDQVGLVEAVGATAERVHGPADGDGRRRAGGAARARRAPRGRADAAARRAGGAVPRRRAAPSRTARRSRRRARPSRPWRRSPTCWRGARRPAIIAGRGAVLAGAGAPLRALGELTGALLATSAVANGLFAGDQLRPRHLRAASRRHWRRGCWGRPTWWSRFGAGLNQWTTGHGTLLAPDAAVAQVDLDAEAIGAHRPVALGVIGDAAATAEALLAALAGRACGRRARAARPRWRHEIAARRWRDEPYAESATAGVLDPRTLSIALDDLLPTERTVVVDSGAFMGWPSMYLRVPDAAGFVFPQAFQCVGLALGNAIGAAIARPDRLTVAALGDGGALMSLPELETLGRLGLPILVVIYDDAAYGAEVHHFAPMGEAVDLAQFPDTDFAALARAAGCHGLTARSLDDLGRVARRGSPRPTGRFVLDAKVDPAIYGEWLAEAFRH